MLVVYSWQASKPTQSPGAYSFRKILPVPRSLSLPAPGARFNLSILTLRTVFASLGGRFGSEQTDLL